MTRQHCQRVQPSYLVAVLLETKAESKGKVLLGPLYIQYTYYDEHPSNNFQTKRAQAALRSVNKTGAITTPSRYESRVQKILQTRQCCSLIWFRCAYRSIACDMPSTSSVVVSPEGDGSLSKLTCANECCHSWEDTSMYRREEEKRTQELKQSQQHKFRYQLQANTTTINIVDQIGNACWGGILQGGLSGQVNIEAVNELPPTILCLCKGSWWTSTIRRSFVPGKFHMENDLSDRKCSQTTRATTFKFQRYSYLPVDGASSQTNICTKEYIPGSLGRQVESPLVQHQV